MTSRLSRRATAATLIAAASASVLAGCGGVGARLTYNDVEKVKITEIVLSGGSGEVLVRTAPIAETRISRVIHNSSDPGETYRIDGSVLTLDTSCGSNCSVHYDIEAPAGVTVKGGLGSGSIGLTGVGATDVNVASGDIAVRNATGEVKVRATSGDVSVLDSKGAITMQVTSGDVRAINVSGGPVSARSTSGDVNVQTITPETVTAHATSGDVTVLVPSGAYQLRTTTSSGDEEIVGVTSDSAAKNVLTASASSGEVRITGTPAA